MSQDERQQILRGFQRKFEDLNDKMLEVQNTQFETPNPKERKKGVYPESNSFNKNAKLLYS